MFIAPAFHAPKSLRKDIGRYALLMRWIWTRNVQDPGAAGETAGRACRFLSKVVAAGWRNMWREPKR